MRDYRKTRWLVCTALLCAYLYRVYGLSYHVVSYLLGSYLLQLLVAYVTPRGLEDVDEEEMEGFAEAGGEEEYK